MKSIPAYGSASEDILEKMKNLGADDVNWKEGRLWSLVYHVDDEHKEFLEQAHNLYSSENYMSPFAFPSLKRMEDELIAMCASLFNGGSFAVGAMTSSGTESIFLAVKSYLDKARKENRIKGTPELIATPSLHPAFNKAAQVLGIKFIRLKRNKDLSFSTDAIAQAISPNTLLIAASSPGFPHGCMDDIEGIAKLAAAHKIPFHVDACVGGFMLPWLEELGYPVPIWDFRLPGVTSISADFHKFGYSLKGCSIILYRSMDYFRNQFFIYSDWEGGVFATTIFTGSRSGGAIASAWAAFHKLGRKGYCDLAQKTFEGTQKMIDTVNGIAGLEVIGKPVINIFAFRSIDPNVDIFVVADCMEKKQWIVDRQQNPNSIHITVMNPHLDIIDAYCNDLRQAVDWARSNRQASGEGSASIYGIMARMPFKKLVEQNIRRVYEEMYSRGHEITYSQDDFKAPPPKIATQKWPGVVNRFLRVFVQ